MATYRGIIEWNNLELAPFGTEKAGMLYCSIPSTDNTTSPADLGSKTLVVPVVYTSPYTHHADGGFYMIPPMGTAVLIEKVGSQYYYLTSIVGDDGSHKSEVSGDSDQRIFE